LHDADGAEPVPPAAGWIPFLASHTYSHILSPPLTGTSKSEFTGTWLVTKEDSTSFWTFSADGTFRKYRTGEPANGDVHFTGTYSVKDGRLSGQFTNTGVGNGEIKCTIDGDGMLLMEFIEFWHSPAKHVDCTGIRED